MSFVSIESLKLRRHWEFVDPLRVIALGGQRELLLHPPSGSWAIVRSTDLPAISALKEFASSGLLDEMEVDDDEPLLCELLGSGLLLKDGRFAGDGNAAFGHTPNDLNMLILKLVGYCNLACAYCYDYNRVTYRNRMDPEVAMRAISQALRRSRTDLNILFHGGEPLMEFELMKRLVWFARDEATSIGRRVSFSTQTNGTRFSPEVVEFLLAEDIRVGVSLDGPAEINDALRIDHAGSGHHAEIEGALREYPRLARRVGILTTVTRHNVDALLDVARYVRGLGVARWDITLFEASGRGHDNPDQFKPETERLIRSHLHLLDAIEDGEFDGLELLPVLKYLRNAMFRQRQSMCLRDGCGAAADLVSIRVDGTMEACDCIQDPALLLGTLKKHPPDTAEAVARAHSIDEALDSPTAQTIRTRNTENLLDCRSCDWRVMCGGTCLAKASLNTIDEQQCRLSMALFPEIFRRLSNSNRLQRYVNLFS